jgi:hypothetical protein
MKRAPFVLTLLALAFAHTARADDAKPPAPADPGATSAPTRHVNKVTDAAKAAFEKIAKAAGNPFGRGMKAATGVLTATTKGAATSMRFTLETPASIRVEADPKAKGDAAAATARSAETVLRMACGVFEPAENAEFDADVVKVDGRDVLQITSFDNQTETSRTLIAVDGNGLVMSSSLHQSVQKRDVKTDSAFAWSKSGDAWKLDRVTTGAGAARTTTRIVYAEEAGRVLPVAWRSETAAGAIEVRMTELVVDGTKADVSKVSAPTGATESGKPDTPKKKHHGKKGKKGEDDEDGEDGEDDDD